MNAPVKERVSEKVNIGVALVEARTQVLTLADPAILLDRSMQVHGFNALLARMLALSEEDLQSRFDDKVSVFELLGEDDLAARKFNECLESGSHICVDEIHATDLGGTALVATLTLIPVLERDQGAVGVVMAFRDISKHPTLHGGTFGEDKDFPGQVHALRADELQDIVEMRTFDLRCALDVVTEQSQLLAESKKREIALQKSVFAGRLATGLAHEFNSPIACILANQSYLASRLEEMHMAMAEQHEGWTAFYEEAQDILQEDSGSIKRLSATVKTLQGFCLTHDPELEDRGPIPTGITEVFHDTELALNATDIDKSRVHIQPPTDLHEVMAFKAEVSLAIVSLMRFLLSYEAPESVAEYSDYQAKELLRSITDVGPRHVQMRAIRDGTHTIVELCCEELIVDIAAAESVFDPSLVVAEDNRVKLSVELSVCAARIARSGGNVELRKSDRGGTIIEVRLMLEVCEFVSQTPTT